MSVLDWNSDLSRIFIARELCGCPFYYLSHRRSTSDVLQQPFATEPTANTCQFKTWAEIEGGLMKTTAPRGSDQLQARCHRHQSTYRFFLLGWTLPNESSSLVILVVDLGVRLGTRKDIIVL